LGEVFGLNSAAAGTIIRAFNRTIFIMAKKPRIPLSAGTPARLNNPFAGLQTAGLAPGKDSAVAAEPPARKAAPGRVVLRRETAHRGGKTVIIVDDFAPSISMASIEELGRQLRNACGCGGTTRGRAIELQGNQPGKIRELLEEQGFRVAGVS
jgi:translation initiation factor 1